MIGDLNPSSIIAVFSRVDMRIMRIQAWHPTAQAVVLLLSCDELDPVKARSLLGLLGTVELSIFVDRSWKVICEVNGSINAFLWCLVKGVVWMIYESMNVVFLLYYDVLVCRAPACSEQKHGPRLKKGA